jgi:hypothetical protein
MTVDGVHSDFGRFLLPYQCAVSTLLTKLDILEGELAHAERHCPIRHVTSRVKSPERILDKAARIGCPLTIDAIGTGLVSDTYRIATMLGGQADITVMEVEDYIAHPKANGYKSLHMIVEIPVHLSDRIQRVTPTTQRADRHSRGCASMRRGDAAAPRRGRRPERLHPGAGRNTNYPIDHPNKGGRPHMSAPTQSINPARARRSGIRLRLKPAHGTRGSVQGAWWPQTDQLHTQLPLLLSALSPRVGRVDRVIYDETRWAPASLRMEFEGRSVILEPSGTTSPNTLSVIGREFGRLDLLVGPPYTNPARAYAAVTTATKPDDVSTPDKLLGIRPRQAQERGLAVLAQQRWESEGGALRRLARQVAS